MIFYSYAFSVLKQIGNNTTSTKKEEREKVEPRGGELRGTSVDKPTYMKGTKLERQIRARLQKGRASQNLTDITMVLCGTIPYVGDVVSVSSVADLDSRKGLIAEPSSNQDQLKSKPKETTHSDPRINVGGYVFIFMCVLKIKIYFKESRYERVW